VLTNTEKTEINVLVKLFAVGNKNRRMEG